MIIFIPPGMIVACVFVAVLAMGITAWTLIILVATVCFCLLGALAIAAVMSSKLSPPMPRYQPAYRLNERELPTVSDNTEELYTRPIQAVKPTEVHNHLHIENLDNENVVNLRRYWEEKQNG